MRARVYISLTSRLWQTIINFRLINDGLMIRRLHHEDDGKYQRVMIVNGSGLTWSVTGVYLLNLELIPSDHPRSLFIFGPSFGIWTVLWPIVCSSFSIILYSLSLSSIIFSPPLVAFLWVELTHEVQSIHTYVSVGGVYQKVVRSLTSTFRFFQNVTTSRSVAFKRTYNSGNVYVYSVHDICFQMNLSSPKEPHRMKIRFFLNKAKNIHSVTRQYLVFIKFQKGTSTF